MEYKVGDILHSKSEGDVVRIASITGDGYSVLIIIDPNNTWSTDVGHCGTVDSVPEGLFTRYNYMLAEYCRTPLWRTLNTTNEVNDD